MLQKTSGIKKFYALEGYIIIFRRKFFVSQDRNEKLRKGALLFSRKFLVWKNFMDNWGGGVSRFFVDFFVSQCRKTAEGNLSVFQKISAKEKNLWIRGGGGVSSFSVENFLSHSAEKFALQCFKNLGY